MEAIIDSRGRTITTSAGSAARMGWKSTGIAGRRDRARAVGLPRKGVIVSIYGIGFNSWSVIQVLGALLG
jgi:hypothetical protein